jgi:hypothetical protein
MEEKIKAIMIIEVAGRPPQYLTDSLKAHVEKLNSIKGVRLVSSKIAEARIIEEEKDLYTSFAEVEVETETLGKLMELVMDYMPSSVEIVEPSEICFNCHEASMLFNDLAGSLHKYDEIAKVARMQIQQLSQRLQQMEAQHAPKPLVSPIQPMRISMEPQKTVEKESIKNTQKKSKKSNKKKH